MSPDPTPATWPAYGAAVCRKILNDMPHLPIVVYLGPDATASTRYTGNKAIRLTPTRTEVTVQRGERRPHDVWWPVGPLLRVPYPGNTNSVGFPAVVRRHVEMLAADLDNLRAAA